MDARNSFDLLAVLAIAPLADAAFTAVLTARGKPLDFLEQAAARINLLAFGPR